MENIKLKNGQNMNILNTLLIMWIILWSINIFGNGTKIALFGGALLLIINLLIIRKISLSSLVPCLIIFAFGVTYSVIINYHGSYNFFFGYREMFIPPIIYLVGFQIMIGNSFDNKPKLFQYIFVTIGICLFLYASINLMVHLSKYGEITMYNRDILDIWSHQLVPATAQGSRYTILIALLAPILLKNKISFKYRIILIAFIIAACGSSLIMANRSIFAILVGSLVGTLLIYLYLYKRNIILLLKSVFVILGLTIISIIVYTKDLFGIKSFYLSSSYYARIQKVDNDWITENSRTEAWLVVIKDLIRFPFGGDQSSIMISSPHNLLLDISYHAGIIPFTLMLIIVIFYFTLVIRILRNSNLDIEFKILITSISIALFLNLMIEPILTGHYAIYMVFILQIGLMHGVLKQLK